MPIPDCPEPVSLGPQGIPPFDQFNWPPDPLAFAPRVAWSCVPVHYKYPDNMKWGFETGYPNVDMSGRVSPLGGYSFPNDVWTRQPFEAGFTNTDGPAFSTDPRVNPWTFIASMRVMNDPSVVVPFHQDSYFLYGTFMGRSGALGGHDAPDVPGSPGQSATAISVSGELSGRYFDGTYWRPIPGGTGGSLATYVEVLGGGTPEEDSLWTGYLAFNLAPLPLPSVPWCPAKASDPSHSPSPPAGGWAFGTERRYAFWATEWQAIVGTVRDRHFQWRGGSVGAIESPFLPAHVPDHDGPWSLAVGVFADPMGRVHARKNGGGWVAGTPDPFPVPGGSISYRWPSLSWSADDEVEIGVLNLASGSWDPAGYTDPRMGRITVTPMWVTCDVARRWPTQHLG